MAGGQPMLQGLLKQDLGVVSGLRRTGQQLIENKQKGQALKQSALAQQLAVSKQRDLKAKQEFDRAQALVKNEIIAIQNMGKEEGVEHIRSLSQNPDNARVISMFGTTAEQVYDVLQKQAGPMKQKELKFKAGLNEAYTGVNEFLDSGNVDALILREDTKKFKSDKAVQIAISLRQSYKDKVSVLKEQLKNPLDSEQRQNTLGLINKISDELVTKTAELFSSLFTEKKESAGSGGSKQQIVKQLISSVVEYTSLDELKAAISEPRTIAGLKKQGIDVTKITPLLIDQWELIQHTDKEKEVMISIEGLTPNISQNVKMR